MKVAKWAVLSVIVLMGAAMAADAFARGRGGHHGGHHHGGHRSSVHFGFGFGWPGWYYPPYAYYPPAYYYRPYYPAYSYYPAYANPPVYVEQGQAPAPAQPQSSYWYYCRDANAYYPDVQQCGAPWELVPPRPPS